MIKYRLKKKYKNMLTFLSITIIIYDLILGTILLYQWRYNKIQGQRPGSVHIKEIFKK